MVWTVLALVLWVILGGFISYYGDLQGRRWGKKRVSWFGLRPKHTAILITSLTGGVIAICSIISLMIIMPPVREVISHGERAIDQNEHLINEQKRQQATAKAELDRVNRESKKQLADSDAKLATGRKELRDLQAKLDKVQGRFTAIETKLASASLSLSAKERQLHTANIRYSQLVVKNTKLGNTNQSIIEINNALGKQNYEYGDKNAQLASTNKALKETNVTLEQVNATLKKIGDQARASNDIYYRDQLRLAAEQEQLELQVRNLTHDRDEAIALVQQRDQLYTQIDSLNRQIAQKYTNLRQGRVILRAGVELGRHSLSAHLRPDAIRRQLREVLATAGEQALKYGAATDENGHAAVLPPQKVVTLTGNDFRDEDAQLDRYSNEWSGQDDSYVIVASTVSNCLAGEAAYVELHEYRVVKVFSKGDEVASRTIDGRSSVDSIIENLITFLQKDVQDSALRAGTIPRVDPESGAAEVGVLGTGDLFRLTDSVRRIRGPVLLTARAKTDLSSADRLNLTFKVSRLPAPTTAVAAD